MMYSLYLSAVFKTWTCGIVLLHKITAEGFAFILQIHVHLIPRFKLVGLYSAVMQPGPFTEGIPDGFTPLYPFP